MAMKIERMKKSVEVVLYRKVAEAINVLQKQECIPRGARADFPELNELQNSFDYLVEDIAKMLIWQKDNYVEYKGPGNMF